MTFIQKLFPTTLHPRQVLTIDLEELGWRRENEMFDGRPPTISNVFNRLF
jgi:hypothetical protein